MAINNDIKESRVSFIVAKLLRKLGFNAPCTQHWEWGNGDKAQGYEPGIYTSSFSDKNGSYRPYTNTELGNTYIEDGEEFGEWSRPTTQMAIEWIRINFDIHIYAHNFRHVYYVNISSVSPKAYAKKDKYGNATSGPLDTRNFIYLKRYDTPYEGYEEALICVLNKLINENPSE